VRSDPVSAPSVCCQPRVAGAPDLEGRSPTTSPTSRTQQLQVARSRVLRGLGASILVANVGRSEYIVFSGLSSFQLVLRSARTSLSPNSNSKKFRVGQPRNSQCHKSGHKLLARLGCLWKICLRAEKNLPPHSPATSQMSW
jgi:hypothetical protein